MHCGPERTGLSVWVARARAEGVELTGDGGLLTGLVRQVLQSGVSQTPSWLQMYFMICSNAAWSGTP